MYCKENFYKKIRFKYFLNIFTKMYCFIYLFIYESENAF